MMCCVPSLTLPVIPDGRIAGSPQPVLSVGGGLILRPWRLADARVVAAAYADPAIQRWHARRDEARDLIMRLMHAATTRHGGSLAVALGAARGRRK